MKEIFLAPLLKLYESALHMRGSLYDRGVFKERRLPAPVVSVGNLTIGGTGKTPVAEYVARLIHEKFGKKVCVLSRGYGRGRVSDAPVTVSDGIRLTAPLDDAGDEPLLLARNLLGAAAVVVCPSRFNGGTFAMETLGAQALVLDDGFQHRSLARDVNLLLVDGADFFGNDSLFPSGPLREPASGIARADAVLFTRTPQNGEERAAAWLHDRAPEKTHFFVDIETGAPVWMAAPPSEGKLRAAAFCAVARPSRFRESLAMLGVDVAAWREFSDHHRYTDAELAAIETEAVSAGAAAVLTTQKDWMKAEKYPWKIPAGYVPLRARARDEAEFIKFLGLRI